MTTLPHGVQVPPGKLFRLETLLLGMSTKLRRGKRIERKELAAAIEELGWTRERAWRDAGPLLAAIRRMARDL